MHKSVFTVLKQLNKMDVMWCSKQKVKKKHKLRENLQKKPRINEIIDILLVKCKEHT